MDYDILTLPSNEQLILFAGPYEVFIILILLILCKFIYLKRKSLRINVLQSSTYQLYNLVQGTCVLKPQYSHL